VAISEHSIFDLKIAFNLEMKTPLDLARQNVQSELYEVMMGFS